MAPVSEKSEPRDAQPRNEGGESAWDKRLFQELERLVAPLAARVSVSVGYKTPDGIQWLARGPECPCLIEADQTADCPESGSLADRRFETLDYRSPDGRFNKLFFCFRDADGPMGRVIKELARTISEKLELKDTEGRLLEELSASWESLEAVYDISSVMGSQQGPAELLDRILARAAAIDKGLKAIFFVEQEGLLEPAAVKGLALPEARPVGTGLIGRAITDQQALVFNDAAELSGQDKSGRDKSGRDNSGRNKLEPEMARAVRAAIAPVITKQGLRGALAVWQEEEAGGFDSRSLNLMSALALQAAMVIENDRLNREMLKTERLRNEVEISSTIQQTFLFARPPENLSGIEIAALSIPSRYVDGDFFDFFDHSSRCLDIVVGDVMGKGIPAALQGAATKVEFARALHHLSQRNHGRLPQPQEIVGSVHDALAARFIERESFVTLFYARFDLDEQELTYVDCGHAPPLIYRPGENSVRFISGPNMPIGFVEEAEYGIVKEKLHPGDMILFYSDGVTEAADGSRKLFGEARLTASVLAASGEGPEGLIASLVSDLTAYVGSRSFEDDLTCLAVRISELPDQKEQSLDISSDLAELENVRRFVGRAWRAAGFGGDDVSRDALELAANEAVSNIISHAYNNVPDQSIRLEAAAFPDRLEIRLIHEGDSFDPETIEPPSFDGSRNSGFGLYIIKEAVDEVRYERDESNRQVIVLSKSLNPGKLKPEPPGSAPDPVAAGDITEQIFMEDRKVEFAVEKTEPVAIVTLAGPNLDAHNVKDFKSGIAPILEENKDLIFDMGALEFLDSSGLGALLGSLRTLNTKGGDLRLFQVTKKVRALFELVRMHKLFEIFNTREEALKSF